MIEKLTLFGIPCFPDELNIEPLRRVNFFYGANATGKTSISKALANIDESSRCTLDWGVNSPLPVYAYNRDFIDNNFRNKIRGIFTLGKFAEASKEIESLSKKSKSYEELMDKERLALDGDETHEGLHAELRRKKNSFLNECWAIKKDMSDSMIPAYTPHQGSKEAFASEIELVLKDGSVKKDEHVFNILKEKAEDYLTKNIIEIKPLTVSDFFESTQVVGGEILSKKIVGKSDVNIARLIHKLQNADWVKEGKTFANSSDGLCPFCQQLLPTSFTQELEDFFDETYAKDNADLSSFESRYKDMLNLLYSQIKAYLGVNEFINNDEIELILVKIENISAKNIQLIATKKKELGRTVSLLSFDEHLDSLKKYLEDVQSKIESHNQIASDLNGNRDRLKSDIWKYTASRLIDKHNLFVAEKKRIEASIEEKKERLSELNKTLEETQNRIKELNKHQTGIEASVVSINSLLKKFGFTSFSIMSSDEEPGYYTLVRKNGLPAQKTLSEGEKTFITFLYFYQLMMGSHDESGIAGDRIVAIDDPISSLDSEVLFIVSELLRELIKLSRQKKKPSHIKQLFILTHNVYFFKEVTYGEKAADKYKKGEIDRSFFIIRKSYEKSECQFYENNPIESSYSLLWREMAECKSNITIQNILRRILEIYFKHFGDFNSIRHIANSFGDRNKIIYNSLMSWAHDGSHSIYDDLYIAQNDAEITKYKEVFKHIFYASKHGAHYEMMYNKYHDDKIATETIIEDADIDL